MLVVTLDITFKFYVLPLASFLHRNSGFYISETIKKNQQKNPTEIVTTDAR